MKIKKALILYKKSTYANYFLDKKSSLLKTRHLIPKINLSRLKNVHLMHYKTLEIVENVLKAEGLHYRKNSRGENVDYSQFDFIITVGGDGTFLEAARHIKNQLILGVNSSPLWSVGKFCTATVETFPRIFKKIIKGQFKIQKLNRLKIQDGKETSKVQVLNDVLIAHANPAAMSRYYITIKGKKEEHRSSGIWISTAAGSTGAIRSAGGKVLPLTSHRFQYLCRELYYGKQKKYKIKKGVLSKHDSIKIVSLMREGMIFVDGSRLKLTFSFGKTITLKHSPFPLKLVRV